MQVHVNVQMRTCTWIPAEGADIHGKIHDYK
jgi:hypothetical protein